MKIDLSKKSPSQLIKLIDDAKVSNLSFEDKTQLIKDIEFHLYGKRCDENLKAKVMKNFEEGQADISDQNIIKVVL